MFRPTRPLRRAVGAVLTGSLCVVVAGCRDDSGGDTAAFCSQVEERLDALRATPQTADDVDALIALWTEVGEDAPLSIEQDWQAFVLMFETAWDPAIVTDDEAAEEAYARMYATERSAVAVGTWVQEHCGFDWGPIDTIVPQIATTAVPGATTVPGASTSATATTTAG